MLSGKRITVDELDACLENHEHATEVKQFLTEAIENGAEVYFDNNKCFNIIARVSEMEFERPNGSKVIGIFMSVHGPRYSNNDGVYTWIAVEDSYGIRDGFNAGDYSSTDGYKTVLSKAVTKSGICDFCNTNVGLKNLIHVGFANKACEKCYPAAKTKLEYPGWTN